MLSISDRMPASTAAVLAVAMGQYPMVERPIVRYSGRVDQVV